MKHTKLLIFFIALLSIVMISCNDDDDDLIGLWKKRSTFDGIYRNGASSFTIGNKGYLVGGFDGKDRYSDLWEYNMDTDTWTQRASIENAVTRSFGVAFEINGKGYYGTGYQHDIEKELSNNTSIDGMTVGTNYTLNGHLGDFWEYDPSSNQWKRIADFPGTPRYYATAFSLNNKGYVGFGQDNVQGYTKDLWAYNPTSNSWESIQFPGDKRIGGSSFVIGDAAYIIGGENNGELLSEFYKYENGSWSELRTVVDDDSDNSYDDDYTTIRRCNGVTFTVDGYAYYTCGDQGSNGSLNPYTWKYDPNTDLWEEVRKFKGSSRTKAVSFSNNGKLGYVVTGSSGSSYYFDDMWSFDPYTYDDDDF